MISLHEFGTNNRFFLRAEAVTQVYGFTDIVESKGTEALEVRGSRIILNTGETLLVRQDPATVSEKVQAGCAASEIVWSINSLSAAVGG